MSTLGLKPKVDTASPPRTLRHVKTTEAWSWRLQAGQAGIGGIEPRVVLARVGGVVEIDGGMDLGHHLRDAPLPAPDTQRTARVVVAGGGIAGLAACHALRSAGKNVARWLNSI